jgi:hypothetical protein
MAVAGHHARLGTRLRARLCRGLHFRKLNSMSFQGTTRTDPHVGVVESTDMGWCVYGGSGVSSLSGGS